jgi:hypothetical protein
MALVRTGYANFAAFPVTGAANIIYVDLSNGNEWIWTTLYIPYVKTNVATELGYKDSAWFTTNASLLLGKGQIVYLEQTGTHKLGDGVTALSALSFLGGSSTTPNLQQVTDIAATTTNGITALSYGTPNGRSGIDDNGATFTDNLDTFLLEIDGVNSEVRYKTVEIATVNDLDTKQNKPIIVSTSITAVLDSEYVMNATSTFTDPTPTAGKGFNVFVLNGTATVGGVNYSIVGTIIKRFYHSGVWLNEVYFDKAFYDTVYYSNVIKDITNGSNITGTTAITLAKSVLVPANTYTTGNIVKISNRSIRNTATGTYFSYIYANTSNSLSGATLIGQFSGAAILLGMERDLYIKSATNSETLATSANSSSSELVGSGSAAASINIDWTQPQYIIHAIQNAAVGNTSYSSGLIVMKK